MAAITAAIATGVQLVKLGDEYNKAINQIAASTGQSRRTRTIRINCTKCLYTQL